MLFLLLFSVVFGKTENITIFSNPEVDVTVKVNSNWLEKGGYEFELKITPSNDLIKDETSKFPFFFISENAFFQTIGKFASTRQCQPAKLNKKWKNREKNPVWR